VLPFLGLIANAIGPENVESADLTRAIANAHTFFNIGMAILFLPISDFYSEFPDSNYSSGKSRSKGWVLRNSSGT
jgi:Na+/phosphate symporter